MMGLAALATGGKLFGALVVCALADLLTGVSSLNLGAANFIVNALTIALAVAVAIPALRSKRKDGTIKDLTDALEAKEEVLAAREHERDEAIVSCRQIEQGCTHLKTDLAAAEARYHELEKYAARDAVTHFDEALAEHRREVAERHGLMLKQLAAQTEAQGRTVEAQQKVTTALERMEQRLDAKP